MKYIITRFGITIGILFFAFGALAQADNSTDAEAQGQKLAQEIYSAAPETNFEQKGTMIIRDSTGMVTNIPINFRTIVTDRYRQVRYQTEPIIQTNDISPSIKLDIVYRSGSNNGYFLTKFNGHIGATGFTEMESPNELTTDQIMASFAGSDFWICDLGLEFLHWPDQKVIKKEFMKGRGCMVLESKNPTPIPGGYSRVDSWIDEEALGIIHAEAYDASGKLLKVFDPKSVKKVNGQWELQDMEIRNVQTGSRTRIEFDLGK